MVRPGAGVPHKEHPYGQGTIARIALVPSGDPHRDNAREVGAAVPP